MLINRIHSIDRGYSDMGWLKTRYSFSFSNYYDPKRMHFGKLRVLNEDIIEGGKGFGMHPHNDMEIITLPIRGGLKHEDSMGNSVIVHSGEVQVMSAGKGMYHSEMNPYKEPVELFQIWIIPRRMGVEPRYDIKSYHEAIKPEQWTVVVGPQGYPEQLLWIYQDAFISVFEGSDRISTPNYKLHNPNNGLYLMVVEGSIQIKDLKIGRRDSLEVTEFESLEILTEPQSRLLAIEVPMK